jgi:probable phosphoglycerate mutase
MRHAHTAFNGEKRYAGSLDIPLSENGVQDAKREAVKLRDLKFDIVITSMLRRSYETAQIIVDGSVPIVRTSLCNERKFGVMEGLTWEDVQYLNPPILMIQVGNDLHTVNPKGGEPFEDVWLRAKKFRNFLFREYIGKNILIVSHGVFLQMFHGLLRQYSCIESLSTYPSNLELTSFKFNGKRMIEEKVRKLADNIEVLW